MHRPMLLVLLELLELLLHVLHLLGDGIVLLFLLLLQRLLLQVCSDEEVHFSLDVLQQLLLSPNVLFLLLCLLAKVLLGRLQRAHGVGHAFLAQLRPLKLSLELLEVLLQLRELCLSQARFRVELIQLLVEAHSLCDQLVVDVLFPLQALLHVVARLVGDLGALIYELQAHPLLGPLLLGLALHRRVLGDGGVRGLDVPDLVPLLVPQRVHGALELLGLLADPIRVGLDFVVVHLVGGV
mmetsp:Transcript_78821/g.176273  ORF Transcript_78821/g.176273 Transcript_78821/m.176273 type:complete len:239 (-) Transcript_78821:22-738(-)